MDTTLILYCICTFFCVNVAFSQEEKSFELKPYGGLSIPVGDFEEFAEPGINTGLALDHYVKPNIGIGLDLNYQNVGLSAPSNFATFLGANNLQQSGFDNQSMLIFTAGPTVRFGKEKFKTEIYSKAGLSLISVPESSVQFTSIDVFRMEEQEITSLGVVSGLRFNYAVNDRVSVFLNPQFNYFNEEIEIFQRSVDEMTDPDMIDVVEGETVFTRPLTASVNGGVNIRLGGKKEKKKRVNSVEVKEQTICLPAKLITPSNQQDFDITEDKRPSFRWDDQLEYFAEYYIFHLLDEKNEVVYTQKTRKKSLKHNKELERIYNQGGEQTKLYYWKVESHFSDCDVKESRINSFRFGSRSGAFHDIVEIECASPFFNSDGSVNYTARIKIYNNISTTSPLELTSYSDIKITTPSGVTINNLRYCNPGMGSLQVPPISIAPGGNEEFCFDFTVPTGSTTVLSEVEAKMDGLQQISRDGDKLPSCVCSICDEDYIIHNYKKEFLIARNYIPTDGSSVYQLRSDFILPTANPIKEIKAEVISVQHQVNDVQCHTCTKDHSRMGMFFDKGKHRIWGTAPWSSNLGQLNNAIGYPSSTQYSNEVTWLAQNQAIGVDMSTQNTVISNQIALPQLSSLSCCNSKFQVCIRYTFTDVDCITCDKVVCYEIDTAENTNGGVGIGIGDDSIRDVQLDSARVVDDLLSPTIGNNLRESSTFNPMDFVGIKHNELLELSFQNKNQLSLKEAFDTFKISNRVSFNEFDAEISEKTESSFASASSPVIRKYGEILENIHNKTKEQGIGDWVFIEIKSLEQTILQNETLKYDEDLQVGNDVSAILGACAIFKYSTKFWVKQEGINNKSIFGKIWRDTRGFFSSDCDHEYEFDLPCAIDAAAAASRTSNQINQQK